MTWNLSNRMAACGACSARAIAERLPHVHDREPDLAALFGAEPGIELGHAGFGAILAAEPDRPPAMKIADHNPVGVPLADRDFINADRLGRRRARPGDLRAHVLHLQRLDRVPVELQLLGHIADRGLRATPSHIKRKAFGEVRVICQKIQTLALHAAAMPTGDAPDLELQDDPVSRACQVADLPGASVVPTRLRFPATATNRFFERRSRLTILTSGSPKTPRTVSRVRNPAKQYPSDSRRRLQDFPIPHLAKFPASQNPSETPYPQRFRRYDPSKSPTRFPEDPLL